MQVRVLAFRPRDILILISRLLPLVLRPSAAFFPMRMLVAMLATIVFLLLLQPLGT